MHKAWKFVFSILVTQCAGVIGSLFTAPAINGWYSSLEKPALSPPNWLFGPVWTTLYLLMGVALYLVWTNQWRVNRQLMTSRKKPWNTYSERLWTGSWQKANTIAVFGIQLALNTLWSLLFFVIQSPGLAFGGILALWFSIVFTIMDFYRISRTAAWLLVPYLLWVSFAAYLNCSLWLINS